MVNKELISLQLGRREQEVGHPSTVRESQGERERGERRERMGVGGQGRTERRERETEER